MYLRFQGALILMAFCFSMAQVQAEPLVKPTSLHLTDGDASLDAIPELHILHFQSASPASSLEHRTDGLRSLLTKYFQDHPKESRYQFTFGPYDELNARMASVASCSSQWDSRAGRVRSGNTAIWLRDNLRLNNAYQELLPVFDGLGFGIDLAAAESIMLCGPSEIDWTKASRTCQTPIPPKAKLPCGALITFDLTRNGMAAQLLQSRI